MHICLYSSQRPTIYFYSISRRMASLFCSDQLQSYITCIIGIDGHISGLRMKAKVQIVTLTRFWSRSHSETKARSVLRGHSSSTVLCLCQSRQINVLQPPSREWLVPCAKSSSPHLLFSPRDKLVSADKEEGVMAQREPQRPRCVFVLGGTLFDTGGISSTDLATWQPGNAGSSRKICLQSLNLIAKINSFFGL